MILFGQRNVRYVIEQYTEHYHLERLHKVLGRRIIEPDSPTHRTSGPRPPGGGA